MSISAFYYLNETQHFFFSYDIIIVGYIIY